MSPDRTEAEHEWKSMEQKFFSFTALQQHLTADQNNEVAWKKRLPEKYINALKLVEDWYNIRLTYWQCYTKACSTSAPLLHNLENP